MIPLIIAGVMIMGALMKSKGEDDQAKVDNIAKASNDKVSKILRNADNQMQAAKDSLTRYQASQSNKYKLETGGNAANAQATNILRTADSLVQGSFERRIAAAEEAGAAAAQIGASGMGGGSANMIENANLLRVARTEQMFSDRQAQQLGDMELELDQTERATILGLDDVQVNTSLNFMEQNTPETPRVNWAKAGLQAGMAGMSAYMGAGGSFGGSAAPTTSVPQQSVAGQGLQQSRAVSTSPFGARPSPTLRMK